MTEEQRKAIQDAIAEYEARARAATEQMLAQRQAARLLRQRAYALRSLLSPATPRESPVQTP